MNRLITDTDDLTYGDLLNSDNGFKPGDLLIDSVNDQGKIGSYFMGNEWKGLKDGGCVWIDGDKIPEGKDILFRHSLDENTGWNEVKNLTIRPIPGTQVKANSFLCLGLLNVKILGSSKGFPGLPALGNKRFLSGNFGFHVKAPAGAHGYKVSVLDGGSAEIEGIEAQWGFSGLRFAEGNKPTKQRLKLSNFYLHDTDTGELLYLGQTVGAIAPKIQVEIFDGFLVRAACEALQAQHLAGSDIYNLTIACADTAWLAAFQAFQDTGIQYHVDSGVNRLYNIILDGFASNGLNFFSSAAEGEKRAEISNMILNDGRYTGHYLHNSNSFGVEWLLKRVFYRAFNNSMVRAGKPAADYVCSKNQGSDVFTFQNCLFDKSKARFFEDPADGEMKQADLLPPVVYMNSGFPESMANIMQWKPFFAPYHLISKIKPTPVHYAKGEIVIDDHRFYRVVNSHSASKRPKESADYMPLTFDENGVRNDMIGWTNTKQREDPPDDLRLKKESFWQGMGYLEPKTLREEIIEDVKTQVINLLGTIK